MIHDLIESGGHLLITFTVIVIDLLDWNIIVTFTIESLIQTFRP